MFDWFNASAPWQVYAISLLLILVAGALGQWLGRRDRRRGEVGAQALVTMLEGALFTLLALMVGFSFAMALTRFDARRDALLQEANAIGTAALRADLLPAPQADAAKRLLRAYVAIRLDPARDPYASGSPAGQQAALRDSGKIQQQLWTLADAASAADPRSVAVGLFVQALNAVVDLQETRVTADRNRIPRVVVLLLYAIAMVAIGYTGYGAGLSGARGRVPSLIMGVLIATVIGLIVDIDYPRSGLVTISEQPMLDVAAGLGM